MNPFLRGFHLSEEAWHDDRDSEGWKVVGQGEGLTAPELDDNDDSLSESDLALWGAVEDHPELKPLLDPSVHATSGSAGDPPANVTPVPCLRGNLEALLHFFDYPSPVQVIVRPVAGAFFVAYGARDASGKGLGLVLPVRGFAPSCAEGSGALFKEASSGACSFCSKDST